MGIPSNLYGYTLFWAQCLIIIQSMLVSNSAFLVLILQISFYAD